MRLKKKKAEKRIQTRVVAYEKMCENAQKAGDNPKRYRKPGSAKHW